MLVSESSESSRCALTHDLVRQWPPRMRPHSRWRLWQLPRASKSIEMRQASGEGIDDIINALDNVNGRSTWTCDACTSRNHSPYWKTMDYGITRSSWETGTNVHSSLFSAQYWALSNVGLLRIWGSLLEKTPNEVNSFMYNPAEYAAAMRKAGDAQARELLERVRECLTEVLHSPLNSTICYWLSSSFFSS